MMEQYKLELTQQGKENIEGTIDTLMQAAQEIAKASEKDFEKMKSKKWYKRLWELVTYSRDNEKMTARGISNLAKLNEIVMKAIVILSRYSAETAEQVSQALQQIEGLEDALGQLTANLKKVALEIKKLKNNYKKSLSIADLKDDERDIVGSIFVKYAKQCSAQGYTSNLATQKLFAYIMEGDVPEEDIDVTTHLDILKPEVQQLLFRLNQSYYYLLTGEFDESEYFDDFDISRKNIRMIQQQIEDAVAFSGSENYVDTLKADSLLEYVDADGIDFEECIESSTLFSEEKNTVEESDEFLRYSDHLLCDCVFTIYKEFELCSSGLLNNKISVGDTVAVFVKSEYQHMYIGESRVIMIGGYENPVYWAESVLNAEPNHKYHFTIDKSTLSKELIEGDELVFCKSKTTTCNDKKGIFLKKSAIFKKYVYQFSEFSSKVVIGLDDQNISKIIARFANGTEKKDVLGFVHETMLQSGKTGFLFTTEGIYYTGLWIETIRSFRYDEVAAIKVTPFYNDTFANLKITLKNGKKMTIEHKDIYKTPLAEFIKEMQSVK